MKVPDIPANEAARLEALNSYEVMDTPAEAAFDDLTELASFITGTPISLVSLVDGKRQWFKSRVGLDATETPRDVSFCGHVVASSKALVVNDAHQDERFADNPLVTGPPHVRFYAGIPLTTSDGHVLGTLCAIDNKPRTLDSAQLEALGRLANQVMWHMERRMAAREAVRLRAARDEAAAEVSRRFFELSLDLCCVAGLDGHFKLLNDSFTELLGYTMDELMATPFADFIHPDDVEATNREAAKLATGTHKTIEFHNRYRKKDGSYVHLVWNATLDPDAGVLLAIARDVTTVEATKTELIRAKEAAERTSAFKSSFLANMSHELRTPLNAVIGFSKLLAETENEVLDEEELTYANRIQINGEHLLALINDVLDLSKIEAGHLELNLGEVHPATLVQELVAQIEPVARKANTTIRLQAPAEVQPIRGDCQRLKQVLLNLVSNAIKFGRGRPILIRLVADGARPLRLDVIDSGVGIARAQWDHVFQPFRQADESTAREHGGTGLGLAISRLLCQAMGFDLSLDSLAGVGSTFSIILDPTAPPAVHRPPSDHPDMRRERVTLNPSPSTVDVLIVDDDEDARAIMQAHVAQLGYTCGIAVDGRDALAQARELRPSLIMLDLLMPNVSGWDALAELRADPELCRVPVVVVSAVGNEHKASLIGAVDVLDKPPDPKALQGLLDTYLGGTGRVLVIDDDVDSRTVLNKLLGALGATTRLACDGHEGLIAVDEFKPDIIILDLNMPVLNGFKFLARLRADPRYMDLPVIIASNRDTNAVEQGILQAQSQARIDKANLDREALASVLARVFQREASA